MFIFIGVVYITTGEEEMTVMTGIAKCAAYILVGRRAVEMIGRKKDIKFDREKEVRK